MLFVCVLTAKGIASETYILGSSLLGFSPLLGVVELVMTVEVVPLFLPII